MVKDFHYIEKEENIGYYIGFISAAFGFAQLTSGMFWGWLSDRIGRRPVLLLGLVASSISLVAFGFSKSLAWAICTRFMCGFLNGNTGVAKCVLGEISDKTNKARAFTTMGISNGIGNMIGPALGGLLSHPAKNYPSLFGKCNLLITFPYLLPCICSASISMIGFISGLFFLPETCTNLAADKSRYEHIPTEAPSCDKNRSSLEENDDNDLDTSLSTVFESNNTELGSSNSKTKQSLGSCAILTAISSSFLVFMNNFWSQLFPIWAAASPGNGLGFNSTDIGQVLSFAAVFNLILLSSFYPWFALFKTPLFLFRVPVILQTVFFIVCPFISDYVALTPAISYLVKPSIFLIYAFRAMVNSTCSTSMMILINASAKPY